MALPLACALFAAFALTLYLLLDGFDLGVGALLLFQPEERLRDRMADAIAPTWDGNETWLIMAGVTLLAAFPIAYGVLMPAFYVPLILMLLCLGLRGVAFEFRYQERSLRTAWDTAFSVGSIGAGLCQGMILGGMIQGVDVSNGWFEGGALDFLSPFALLTGVTLVGGYAVLGSAWLFLKSAGELQRFAAKRLRAILPVFVLLAALACVLAPMVQPDIGATWAADTALLVMLCAAFVAAALLILRSLGRAERGEAHERTPFLLGLAMFAIGILGLAIAIFPNVVPFRISITEASSPPSSQRFLLFGATFVTPIVLAYNAFAYRIFRGKTPSEGWD